MHVATDTEKTLHAKTAYHIEWGFRREAAAYEGEIPFAPNLHAIGWDLRLWMLRQGNLTFYPHHFKEQPNALTNPYTYDASILASTFAEVVNNAVAFTKRTDFYGPEEAEFCYMRLYTELVLYSTRLLEALIKQMLFCTTFPEGEYKNATLGALLERNCSSCQAFKEKRHKVSLMGSLAHRYGFCQGYEKCLNSHMNIVRRRRNIEAAHSSTIEFLDRTVDESNGLMQTQLDLLGNELIHMLQHIGDIELHMVKEMKFYIAGGKYTPEYVIHFAKNPNAD